jgi:hypothetical protein
MDPFERQFRRRANIEAIIAFVIAIVIAYFIHELLGMTRQNSLFTVLIVLAVGGLWYHIRRVV